MARRPRKFTEKDFVDHVRTKKKADPCIKCERGRKGPKKVKRPEKGPKGGRGCPALGITLLCKTTKLLNAHGPFPKQFGSWMERRL